ncbi:MAG: IS1380 family transposase [Candidatus Binatia bacterium]
MANDITKQGVLFKGLSKKALIARFDQEQASSDGGAILLKACDERLGLSARLAACLTDGRQQTKVEHSYRELFQQRMFGIACGYADGNDAARLAGDPVFKLLSGRDPVSGSALASQPTLSRFENAPGAAELFRMSEAVAESVIQRQRRRKRRVKLITIDLDPTDDLVHGGQQLSFFNRLYDNRCYLPLAGFLTFDGEPEQYLFCYLLRPGNAAAKQGCLGILKRLLPRLRRAFPKAKLRIRLDAGFTGPELYEFFEAERLEYVVCMAKNARLLAFAEPLLVPLRQAVAAEEAFTPAFGEYLYRAHRWNRARRVIIKADIALHPGRPPKDNPRFIVTNLKTSPKHVYRAIYCARGDMENRIKELKDGLQIDRTSCVSFKANQLRVLITAAAYVLMQELRLRARGTRCARAQVDTLRLRLLKLGAWIDISVRRIVVHLPLTAPYANEWRRIARAVGAVPT